MKRGKLDSMNLFLSTQVATLFRQSNDGAGRTPTMINDCRDNSAELRASRLINNVFQPEPSRFRNEYLTLTLVDLTQIDYLSVNLSEFSKSIFPKIPFVLSQEKFQELKKKTFSLNPF